MDSAFLLRNAVGVANPPHEGVQFKMKVHRLDIGRPAELPKLGVAGQILPGPPGVERGDGELPPRVADLLHQHARREQQQGKTYLFRKIRNIRNAVSGHRHLRAVSGRDFPFMHPEQISFELLQF